MSGDSVVQEGTQKDDNYNGNPIDEDVRSPDPAEKIWWREKHKQQLSCPLKPAEQPSTILRLGSLFGRRKPLNEPAWPGQNIVWLLDNTAYQSMPDADKAPYQGQSWHVEVVACVFLANSRSRKDVGKFVAALADLIGLDGRTGFDTETRHRIEHKLQPFLDHIAPGRLLTLDVPLPSGRLEAYNIGPTDVNGISSQVLSIGRHNVDDGTAIHPFLHNWDPAVSMNTVFAVPEGWLVISDIDDTLKHTQTGEPGGILRTTFAEEPRPIMGMPRLYELVDKMLVPTWFYVSASPYNLYPFLRAFLRTHYRQGTVVLRDYSWMDLDGLIKSFTEHTFDYKVDRIKKIHRWLPRRRVLCIGDSTQSDPEAYAELYRRYPGWIEAIFIRKVTNVAHMEQKNLPERFATAFQGVPTEVWTLFERPEELYQRVQKLSTFDFAGLIHAPDPAAMD